MSLTSKELNYLIWRYFQETGYDLTAYTFDRQSQCSKYENNLNDEIIDKIEPGCLIDLVQKGILYTIAETEAKNDNDYTLLGALVQKDLEDSNLKYQIKENGNNVNEHENEIHKEEKEEEDVKMDDIPTEEPLEVKTIVPEITFPPSLTCDWHPSSEAFAYGKSDGNAIITAIKDGQLVESVEISHPSLLNIKNEINFVSWSPMGNLLITAGAFGELRAWSPDGRLKNIANTMEELNQVKTNIITNILWSQSGKFVVTIDSENQITIWDGLTLSLVRQIKNENENDSTNAISTACWLGDDKFAISSSLNHDIKLYDIKKPPSGKNFEFQYIGTLVGHSNNITLMKLNPVSKLLATCSDFDYQIRIWNSSSTQPSLDLNIKTESNKIHSSPIIELNWLPYVDKNYLLSISMEGILNIWDGESGEALKSCEIFKDKVFDQDRDMLVFNSSVSPNGKLLAVGDDYGKISIWDLNFENYTNQDKSYIKCLATYTPEIKEETEEEKQPSVGLCDLKWDHESKKLIGSYIGLDSVVIYST
ncbi:hypothetical protein KGF54_000419 [Candida jiufengensis]|uniref:uncharacterized protein n=1 Tax=Candida jiufengensis TaxID=497108 RepID=UPI002224DDB4|nr:uncharacterized protein KGF54_000419 [Candida jiufengensis]KAI5956802.1 hypothetical protein KGF54_000419 [Candida jiufengensis]